MTTTAKATLDNDFIRVSTNYFSSVFVAFLGLMFYTKLSGWHLGFYNARWEPQTVHWQSGVWVTLPMALNWLFVAYAVVLLPYFMLKPSAMSKSSLALSAVWRVVLTKERMLSHAEVQAMLNLLLKFIFVPFILNAGIWHLMQLDYKCTDLVKYYQLDELQRPYFVADLSLLLMQITLAVVYLIDIVPFVVGYLTESDLQENRIKSVDSTAIGWFFCLMCYPPFINAVNPFFGSNVPDRVESFVGVVDLPLLAPYLHMLMNAVAAVLLLAYASCSVSIGWKCSNLTSRGLVSSGMYAVVRHPAYICKNAAWWVFAIGQAVHSAAANKPWLWNLVCLAVFTGVYFMRAITEERHMRATDREYESYANVVPWRFIPGLL